MRYLSAEFTNRLANNSTLTAKATVRFADGTSRELAGEDFCSLSVEQASSSSGSFDIGAAVVGQLTCALNNYDDRFSECDFEGAAMTVWVGATLPSGNEEWVKLGVYYVDRPDSYAGQISLTALDCLSLLEKDYSPSTFSSWPKTLQQIADAGCLACGLMNDTTEIPNGSYSVASEPELDDATWLDVMGYVAQATGTFVRATDDGHVEFAWYDTSAFESEDWNDGGSFDSASPYATGDAADGGNFTDYSSGDSMDGGEFSAARRLGVVNRFFSLTVFTDDVVITGVSVTAQNQVIRNSDGSESNGEDGETALYGSEGYVLSLADNPLVLYGQAASVASQVGKRVVGMSLRPFSCDAVTDPSIEPGDAVLVYDRKGNEYRSYVTSTNIAVNGSESIECGAQSSSRHSAGSASAATKAIVKARNDLNREKTSRQKAIEDLTEKISESSGLFSTTVELPDGSSIVYLHDRSDLQSSKIVWKMTAEAVAVSTSGPEGPYATGLTADGTAILNRIYAVGINADYISDGALEDGTGKNYWNLKTGELRMTGYAKDSETISSVDVEYAQNTSATTAPTSGWQTAAPAYKSGYYIWSRTKTVNADGSASYSTAVMISGRDGDTGATGTGVSAIAEQYYLSTSKTAQSGGSWSETQPAYVSGRYYWTRSKVTWTDGKVTYTTPVLAQGVNNANESAQKANDAVTTLDEALDQEEVLNRLTNGSKEQGIYLENGKLYINGTYIKSGTVDAGLLKAGTIQDGTGKNYWNLKTGEMSISSYATSANAAKSIIEQYYLSTSSTTQTGGSWSTTQPTYVSGRYYWTRKQVTYANGGVAYTDPVLSNGVNGAIKAADAAQDGVDTLETLVRVNGQGVEVARKVGGSYTSTKAVITDSAYAIQDKNGNSICSFASGEINLGKNIMGTIYLSGTAVIHSHAQFGTYIVNESGISLSSAAPWLSSSGNASYPSLTVYDDEIAMQGPLNFTPNAATFGSHTVLTQTLLWSGTMTKSGWVYIKNLPNYRLLGVRLDGLDEVLLMWQRTDSIYMSACTAFDDGSSSYILKASFKLNAVLGTQILLRSASKHELIDGVPGTSYNVAAIYGIF